VGLSRPLLALLLIAPSLSGCISFALDGRREGLPRKMLEVQRLERNKTTMAEAIERLGPPDLVLRSGEIDRLYYVSWDSFAFKFSVSAPVPFIGRSASTDAYILGLGNEELQLARLEFDRRGLLTTIQAGGFASSNSGQYFIIDNRIVESFLEDRNRALLLVDNDDDDDDDKRHQ
jgi:hypothetical protein